MLPDIQRKKVAVLYLVLDADENGFIERFDFERIAKKMAAAHDISQFSDRYRSLRESLLAIYDDIKANLDLNDNYRVELQELMAYVEVLIATPSICEARIFPLARDLFHMLDLNANGKISFGEWKPFADVCRISTDDMQPVFDLLDVRGNGYITQRDFQLLMLDFFLSEDPSKPGNYTFGRF